MYLPHPWIQANNVSIELPPWSFPSGIRTNCWPARPRNCILPSLERTIWNFWWGCAAPQDGEAIEARTWRGVGWRADIDALRHVSSILGHCWDAQEFVTSCFSFSSQFLSSVLAWGVTPTNWMEEMCKPLIHPCNVRDTYWHALDHWYLDEGQ